ncbi:MAG: hypothetical protein JWL70_1618 [Acidimicrobiia bacterium]|nr:hypothetical protein [Acidimicrobiia bacterium]
MKRRLPVVVVLLLVLLIPALIERGRSSAKAAGFGELLHEPLPFGRVAERISSSWFCAALPSGTGDKGLLRVLNPGIADLSGTVTIWENERPDATKVAIVVPAGSSKVVDVSSARPGDVNAAMVEMIGGEVFVESTVKTGPTTVTASCASNVANTWSFVEGSTELNTNYRLAIFNPLPADTVVDIDTITQDQGNGAAGFAAGGAGKGVVVNGRSLKVISVNEQARRAGRVSVVVRSRGGKVVVGRLLSLNTSTRQGLIAGVASAGDSTSWWWAGAEMGTGTNAPTEQVVIANPSEDRAELDLSIYPATPPADPATQLVKQVSIPPQSVISVDISGTAGLPPGPHAIELESSNGVPVVAERVVDERTRTTRRVSAVAGSPVLAKQWYLVEGAATTPASGVADEEIAVMNPTSAAVKVSVRQVVPGGSRVLSEVDVAPGVPTRIKLAGVSATEVVSLFVRADTPIVVERRRLTSGAPWSLAIPVL